MKSNKSLRLNMNHSMEKTTRPCSAYTPKPYVISSKNLDDIPPVLYTMPTQSKGMGAKIEKEQLYEQTMQLKRRVNRLKAELDEAKSTIVKKELDLRKKEKIIEDLSKENDVKIVQEENLKKAKESTLITLCKRKYYEMKDKYEKACEENEVLKSNIKITKIKEIQVVTEVLENELEQMKNLYIHSKEQNKNNLKEIAELQEFKVKFFQQHQIIETLQQNYENANKETQDSKEEIGKLRERMAKNESEYKKLKIENQKLKASNEKYLNEKKMKEKSTMNQAEYENTINQLRDEVSKYKNLYTAECNRKRNSQPVQPLPQQRKVNQQRVFDYNSIRQIDQKSETEKDVKINLYKNIIKDQNIKINIYEEYLVNSGADPEQILLGNRYEGVINSKFSQKAKAKSRPKSSKRLEERKTSEINTEEEQKVQEIDLEPTDESSSKEKDKYVIPQNEEDSYIDPEKILRIFQTNFSGRHTTKNTLLNELNKIYEHFESKNEASTDEFIEPFLNLLKDAMKASQETDVDFIKEFLLKFLETLSQDTGRFFEILQNLFEQTEDYTSLQNEAELNQELANIFKPIKKDLLNYLKYNTIEGGNIIDCVIFEKIVIEKLHIEMAPTLYLYLLFKMKESTPEISSIFNLNYSFISDLVASNINSQVNDNIQISSNENNLYNLSSVSSKFEKENTSSKPNQIDEKSNESRAITEEEKKTEEDEIEKMVVDKEKLNKTMGGILSSLIYSYKQFDAVVEDICEEVDSDEGKKVRGMTYEDFSRKLGELGIIISDMDRKYILKTYRMKNKKLNADKMKEDLSKMDVKYLTMEKLN